MAKQCIPVCEEDIVNLENIRNIMMNLEDAGKMVDMDVTPEIATLDSLIDQFQERNKSDVVNKRCNAFIELFTKVYQLSDVRASLLRKDIEAIIADNS